MECGKRVGKGTIAYPCYVTKTKETPDPEFGGFHEGPCAVREQPNTVAVRQRWESGAQARATLHAHQSPPQTFGQVHGAHDPTPVPGSGLQPAEHRATYRPVVGGFGEQPVVGPPCQHPFGALYEARDGATVCGECNERLREPENAVAPEGTLGTFVEQHQAPPEVLAARAAPIPRAEVEAAQQQMGASMGDAIAASPKPPPIEGAEPFPGLPAAPPQVLFTDPPSVPNFLAVGTEVAYVLDGHAQRGTIVPSQEGWSIPEGSYAVRRDGDDSVWSVAAEAITAVIEKSSDPEHAYNGGFTGPALQAQAERAEPTKQRSGDQPLPAEGNPRPAVQQVIIAAMEESMTVGVERYGDVLRPMNGRNTLIDAKEEARDLYVYLTGFEMERIEILDRFERAYSRVMEETGGGLSTAAQDDLDFVLAWLRGAPQT